MAPTPSPRPVSSHGGHHHPQTPSKTPHSKHRLNFTPRNGSTVAAVHPSPNPLSAAVPTEHPVEVIGRIRDYPERKEKPVSALEIAGDGRSVRVRTDIGYRDFSLDGVSVAEDEDLEGFYRRFVESRVEGVRFGAKCTIMMYGPTGSGKSHTMFGCAKQPGIVYRALKDILEGEGEAESGVDDAGFGIGLFVQVAVLEIYNEEIYDLLSGNSSAGGVSAGLPKGGNPKVRLEVMGKKAKNAMYISGNEAGKISREVAKVEKRRIVKSTLCNERSSRSHCLIILDVPSVGGRLMLVDMAGSENIEAAGQTGFEAKMQTAKINQGNIALKRVVESIANGDSHVPFRDSKLTMLLQDSFEDDKSKILMILCASPDPKEMHKTISTLEYGAKAKCIVRVAHMPTPKEKVDSEESSTLLRSRIVAMNQFIHKLQMDNKVKEKERDEAQKELIQKEEELAELRAKLQQLEAGVLEANEDEINLKVDQITKTLRVDLIKMEEKILQQQEELNMLRQRLEEAELARGKVVEDALQDINGGRFMKHLETYMGEQGMEKSMDLDMGDQQTIYDVKEIKEDSLQQHESCWKPSPISPYLLETESYMYGFPDKACLSTVFEGDEEGEDRETTETEIDKEVVEVNAGNTKEVDGLNTLVDSLNYLLAENCHNGDHNDVKYSRDAVKKQVGNDFIENAKDAISARKARIQNIFRLCGNQRELAQQVKISTPPKKTAPEDENNQPSLELEKKLGSIGLHAKQEELRPNNSLLHDLSTNQSPNSKLISQLASLHLTNEQNSAKQLLKRSHDSKENVIHGEMEADELIEVYVKWEASKEFSGSLIKKLKVLNNSTLADLRKIIEASLEEDNHKFTILLLGDPTGAPVSTEREATIPVSKLPVFNNQLNSHLACLRPIKKVVQRANPIPLGSLENTLDQPNSNYLSRLRV